MFALGHISIYLLFFFYVYILHYVLYVFSHIFIYIKHTSYFYE